MEVMRSVCHFFSRQVREQWDGKESLIKWININQFRSFCTLNRLGMKIKIKYIRIIKNGQKLALILLLTI